LEKEDQAEDQSRWTGSGLGDLPSAVRWSSSILTLLGLCTAASSGSRRAIPAAARQHACWRAAALTHANAGADSGVHRSAAKKRDS